MYLKEFQKEAIKKFKYIVNNNVSREIVFKSPTGSGKTITLINFIDQMSAELSNTIFVWLTPGKGELEEQSRIKMDKFIYNAQTKNINDVLTCGFSAGDTVFINWEMIVNKKNLAVKDIEDFNLFDKIKEAKNKNLNFFLIVDEEHLNATVKSEDIITAFSPIHILRTSATVKENKNASLVEVSEQDVIKSGLIKKMLFINENLEDGASVENQVNYLLDLALSKHEKIRDAMHGLDKKIVPLIIVQVPSKSEDLIAEVEKYFISKDITYDNNRLAIWLSGRKENIESISENNSEQYVLIMKQAISTGWDCPRAHILVKLRDNMSEVFELQTIGRIRRMPEATHYNSELLDSCYLYTFDEKYSECVKDSWGDNACDVKDIYLKPEHKSFKINKQFKTKNILGIDERRALSVFNDFYKNNIGVGTELDKNQDVLMSIGYNFSKELLSKVAKGSTGIIDEANILNMSQLNIKINVDTHDHGRYLNRVIQDLADKTGMTYDVLNSILRRLFQDDGNRKYKILKLELKEFYAFIINNCEKLKIHLLQAVSRLDVQLELEFEETKIESFVFPRVFSFKYNKSLRDTETYRTNVYDGYLSSAKPRSKGEEQFEEYCNNCYDIKWWYKNGDKSTEYYSILYLDNIGKAKAFYPDYILEIKGKIWIIETKGGVTTSGQDNNIDPFAAKKFSALKKYCAKDDMLNFGFVRLNMQNDKLYISNNEYVDDMRDDRWMYLRSFNFD